ncbi:MAG: polysaccharide biosynthesis tyrosine autokinase [Chitinophagaceae bacterium]|nr:MAG: polysaccharide biosynthesis tyrosine autokinase [Chitinophagaceae bacterium]
MEQSFIDEKESGGGFDPKTFFSNLGKNWYWFVIALVVFVGGAYLYLKFTQPLYKLSTYVLIKKPTEAKNLIGGTPFAGGSGESSSSVVDISSEIFKLRSGTILGEALDSLNMQVSLISNQTVKNQPVSLDSVPFEIVARRADPNVESQVYTLQMNERNYRITGELLSHSAQYGQPMLLGRDTIIITRKPSFKGEMSYDLQLLSREELINKYIGRIEVSPVPQGGPEMLQVSVTDEFTTRAEQLIKVLVYRFDLANLDYKNKALRVEMTFLQNRLNEVTEDLNEQESIVSNFKSSNQINDVSTSATELLTDMKVIDKQKSENELKQNMLSLLETNVRNATSSDEVVNAVGLTDPVLNDLINKYNTTVARKKDILEKGTALDPRLEAINTALNDYRTSILRSSSNLRQELKASQNFLSSQERSTSSRFSTLPSKEKNYVQVNRVLNLKQAVYMFLMERKSEKELELASAEVAESRIIDSRLNKKTREPQPLLVYQIALACGILIPALVILLQTLLNKKIETRKDIEAGTSLPVAGEIDYAASNSDMVMLKDAATPSAEQFRTLRTNISYLSQDKPAKVMLVTSSISEEGKSFVSLNLANSYAIRSKKVVLLEFDLRSPGLSEKLNLTETTGLANYLADEAAIDQVIRKVDEYENLYFISAGFPLPPNPGEIILSNRMAQLFEYLKANFDVVVIDTPPVGLVSDAISLGKWADLSFFVVRHKYSLRTSLKLVNKLKEEKKLPSISIIINGIKGNAFNSGNKYGGYGYGYNYGKKKFKKRLGAGV